MPRTRAELKHLVREVQGLYQQAEAAMPPRQCRAETTCCRFRLAGHVPFVTAAEAWVAAAGLRAAGRTEISETRSSDGACPCLDELGRCRIYAHRPLGCRTHFCAAAGGVVPRAAVQRTIRELEAISANIEAAESNSQRNPRGRQPDRRERAPRGPKQFPLALAEALEAWPRK